jgi:hypothetical protein
VLPNYSTASVCEHDLDITIVCSTCEYDGRVMVTPTELLYPHREISQEQLLLDLWFLCIRSPCQQARHALLHTPMALWVTEAPGISDVFDLDLT